ncbi:hypothetical protein JCM6882_008263 [Rhodosporidiobolus microsporus]
MSPLSHLVLSWLPLQATFTRFSSSSGQGGEHLLAGHRTAGEQWDGGLDDWIGRMRGVAVDKVFANTGSAAGAAPGVVIASPSTSDPDYFYTWTRDAALVSSGLLSLLPSDPSTACAAPVAPENTLDCSIQNGTLDFLADYVDAQAVLQKVDNPSGTYDTFEGLGEPKFHVDLTAFTGEWGRPQRDGPALRARTILQYLDYADTHAPIDPALREKALSVVRADLDYTVRFWNHTTFDLWEETLSSSFFTTMAQYHALRLGAELFTNDTLGSTAEEVLCFAQEYLVDAEEGGGRWVRSNVNVENGVQRSGVDSNSMLATLLHPPSSPSCAPHLHTPCSPSSLHTLSLLLRSFHGLYPINSPAYASPSPSSPFSSPSPPPSLRPLAMGRYREDTYFGGNPWFLTTLGAAEQLYRAVEAWEGVGEVVVDEGAGGFWEGVTGREVEEGRYRKGDREEYGELVGRVWDLADGLLDVVRRFTPPSGQMDEQIDKLTGEGKSARDLTWSYISLLTCLHARDAALSARKNSSFSSSSSPSVDEVMLSVESLSCPGREGYNGTMEIGFEVEVRTEWGESILLVGSSPSLGDWFLSSAILLTADDYTPEKPVWKTDGAVKVEGRMGVEYKFVKVSAHGGVLWEGGANRIMYTSSGGQRTIKTKWKDS